MPEKEKKQILKKEKYAAIKPNRAGKGKGELDDNSMSNAFYVHQ